MKTLRTIGIFVTIATAMTACALAAPYIAKTLNTSPAVPAYKPFDPTKTKTLDDIQTLFDVTPEIIEGRAQATVDLSAQKVAAILAMPAKDRTFQNTFQELDAAEELLYMNIDFVTIFSFTNSNKDIRDAADKAKLMFKKARIDMIKGSPEMYEACSQASKHIDRSSLNEVELRYMDHIMARFAKTGMHLDPATKQEIKEKLAKIDSLSVKFGENIAQDSAARHITISPNELPGLEQEFIDALEKTDDGQCIIGVDYPTYVPVITTCENENTRKLLWKQFGNRGYPANEAVLKELIKVRDQVAHLLGYPSYAHSQLNYLMVKNPETANNFLDDLLVKASKKQKEEFTEICECLHPSISLTEDGKLKPWDSPFATTWYRKQKFEIDEEQISKYFPFEHTIEALLHIYEQFLDLEITQVTCPKLWDDSVRMFEIRSNQDQHLMGRVILDPFPRPGKYTHGCHCGAIQAVTKPDGTYQPALSCLITNFNKPTAGHPALLRRGQVTTFFHEFGHALHHICGSSQFCKLSGTSTVRDFVEMPSQMLEEWLSDPKILKMVSKHYQTGQSLPDHIIEKIMAGKTATYGTFVARQIGLSKFALWCFLEGENKEPSELNKKLNTLISPHVAHQPGATHFYASFGHLEGYGAAYYGYLWSRAFALDMFDKIKSVGLLNPEIGRVYRDQVIGKGATVDANILIEQFLGRKPTLYAFLKNGGL